MNETAKKVLLAVVIVAAVVFAFLGAKRLFMGDQPQIVRSLPADPNAKSEKRRALEAQGQVPGQQTAPAAAQGERDLSGAIGGG